MQLHLAPAAATVMLLLLAGGSVLAADGMAQDDVCTGSKPFREVAQDETRTMAELCAMQEERLREDRGWKDTRRSRGETESCATDGRRAATFRCASVDRQASWFKATTR